MAEVLDVGSELATIPQDARDQVLIRASVITDDEIRRLYRVAEALAASGVYKDVKDAKMAFAKIIVGHDLGLSPARSMQGLHFVEGNIQMHYRTLGAFVRENGYDYKFGVGNPQKIRDHYLAVHGPAADLTRLPMYWPIEPTNESVTLAFFGPLQTIPGSTETYRDWLGDSKFDDEDMTLAGLQNNGGSSKNHLKYPRNMKTARAMSNGIGWYCPEVMRGIPVYVEDEIPTRDNVQLTEGSGDQELPHDIGLTPKIDSLIARAQALPPEKREKVSAIASREAVVMTLAKRGPDVWREWETWAELQVMAQEAPEDAPVVDAVETADSPPETPVASGVISGEVVDLTPDEEKQLAHQQGIRARMQVLEDLDPHELTEERAAEVLAELEQLERELGEDEGIRF